MNKKTFHQAEIDITFNVYSDARGGDPDSTSPTLRRYHQILWSKPLPDGQPFHLSLGKGRDYLTHSSSLGQFSLGSDAITHSYKNQKKKQWIFEQIPDQVDELFNTGSTIGAYILFPNKQIDRKQTINQERGTNPLIDDRFDLTLECIRRLYAGAESPLSAVLSRYSAFFDLFANFKSYVEFFLLNDLLDENDEIKFYLPFDQFKTKPVFSSLDDYLTYKERVITFIKKRNERILAYQDAMA